MTGYTKKRKQIVDGLKTYALDNAWDSKTLGDMISFLDTMYGAGRNDENNLWKDGLKELLIKTGKIDK